MGVGVPYTATRAADRAEVSGRHRRTKTINSGERFPTSIVQFSNANSARRGKVHPTQKPVELMAYLIRTYCNECETVLNHNDEQRKHGRRGDQGESQLRRHRDGS